VSKRKHEETIEELLDWFRRRNLHLSQPGRRDYSVYVEILGDLTAQVQFAETDYMCRVNGPTLREALIRARGQARRCLTPWRENTQ